MQASLVNKLLTCRYCALDPYCPNIDAFGTPIYAYPHWGTGRLAGHFHQRGTCFFWGWSVPRKLELQIADAATKSGFNTWNHETLCDLIWAVERIGLQAGVTPFSRMSIPRDPIYPDTCSPGGTGN
ncbi:uncharacterized protein Z518_06979 [Rhinocladiella mackenziei CBS 650.93]|uniref:Uncharacterized protein n=1 Tax=Rhinocladiella mackenziei CBS 650.93 TaxID=1442369 RepID=A0A0D2FN03_9EURO|nr:uncharacterized protein Z518_06979 [Rhinocladiella mackenziei CBS 650.93]KIX03427.1 hypothetical protein Z518_06979 [Rhinocladiella mackenziei CBS 650.93]